MATITMPLPSYQLLCSRTSLLEFESEESDTGMITLGPFPNNTLYTGHTLVHVFASLADLTPAPSLFPFHYKELLEIAYQYECPLLLDFIVTHHIKPMTSPHILISVLQHNHLSHADQALQYILNLDLGISLNDVLTRIYHPRSGTPYTSRLCKFVKSRIRKSNRIDTMFEKMSID